jgi:hypothetical protein
MCTCGAEGPDFELNPFSKITGSIATSLFEFPSASDILPSHMIKYLKPVRAAAARTIGRWLSRV